MSKKYFTFAAGSLLAFGAGSMFLWYPHMWRYASKDPSSPINNDNLTNSDLLWLQLMQYIGAIVAPALITFDNLKRGIKWAFIECAASIILAIILFAFADALALYYVAQFTSGMALGGSMTILLTYYAEISSPAYRAAALASVSVTMAIGKMFSYIVSVETSKLGVSLMYGIIACIFLVLCFYLPQSPYHLLMNNKEPEAIVVLTGLRGGQFEQSELEEIRAIREGTSSTTNAALVICSLFLLQNLTGAFDIESSTLEIWLVFNNNYYQKEIIFYVIQILSCILGILLVSKFKKSLILIISFTLMALCNLVFLIAPYRAFIDHQNWTTTVAFGIIWFISYNMGLGIIPWVLMAEMLPIYRKALTLVVAASSYWFFALILLYIRFSNIRGEIQVGNVFNYISIFSCTAGILISVLCVPDTRGKSLKEIQSIVR